MSSFQLDLQGFWMEQTKKWRNIVELKNQLRKKYQHLNEDEYKEKLDEAFEFIHIPAALPSHNICVKLPSPCLCFLILELHLNCLYQANHTT